MCRAERRGDTSRPAPHAVRAQTLGVRSCSARLTLQSATVLKVIRIAPHGQAAPDSSAPCPAKALGSAHGRPSADHAADQDAASHVPPAPERPRLRAETQAASGMHHEQTQCRCRTDP